MVRETRPSQDVSTHQFGIPTSKNKGDMNRIEEGRTVRLLYDSQSFFEGIKILVKSTIFAIQHIEKVLMKCPPPPPPSDQTNPFAYCCSFVFHTSYKNGIIGQGGTMSKCSKNSLL